MGFDLVCKIFFRCVIMDRLLGERVRREETGGEVVLDSYGGIGGIFILIEVVEFGMCF